MSGNRRVWTANGCRYEAADGYQSVTLPMKSTGKARPIVTVKGTYMPADYKSARAALRSMFGTVLVKMPCSLKVTTARKVAASASRKTRAALLWTYCTVKPDGDNVLGWVMDALFKEDAAVARVECVKVWGPRDVLRVELWALDPTERAVNPAELALEL